MNQDLQLDLATGSFSGVVPIIPVTAPAVFPHATEYLRIRDASARALIADAINADQLVAAALRMPGAELHADPTDALIHPVVCLCRVSRHDQLSDECSQVFLRGLVRARVDSESASASAISTTQVETIADRYSPDPTIDRSHRRNELIDLSHQLYPELANAPGVTRTLESDLSLGALCDLLAQAMHLPEEPAARVLETVGVDQRSDLILGELRSRVRQRYAGTHCRSPSLEFSRN